MPSPKLIYLSRMNRALCKKCRVKSQNHAWSQKSNFLSWCHQKPYHSTVFIGTLFPRRTVHDKMTGKDIVLPDEDVALIQRIQDGRYPETTFDPYEPWIDFFTHEKMIHPVTRRPEHKRSFIPSLLEKEKVGPDLL